MTKDLSYQQLFKDRERFANERLENLRMRFKKIRELEKFPKLTIFAAGSYARLEASEYSDIDMFFLSSALPGEVEEPKTSRIRMFARIIDVVEDMKFQKFSNDGKYLEVLHMNDMIKKLGSPSDDYDNHFTTRMLLLLESKCLYRETLYEQIILKIIGSYFKDYPKHKNNFKPLFLMNDIIRYWKTLCLNYENERYQKDTDPVVIAKHKVRNFKLKFSRMTTCFATITALSCQLESITDEDVIRLVGLTPRQRLERIPDCIPGTKDKIAEILTQYSWFLQMTSLPTDTLDEYFTDKKKIREAFERANDYGDQMFQLLQLADEKYNIFRYLVI